MKRSIWTVSIVLLVSVLGCAGLGGKDASSASKTPGGPVLWLDSKTIDLGIIAAGEETIVGTIPIMNDGDEPLEILKVDGPCSCFMGSSGDKLILPGQGGVITVTCAHGSNTFSMRDGSGNSCGIFTSNAPMLFSSSALI